MTRREKLQVMLQAEPDDTFLNYSLAQACVSANEPEEAVRLFARVRELDPNYVPAFFQAGQLLHREGRITEAAELLKRGISVAKLTGDQHAFEEMTGYLENLD